MDVRSRYDRMKDEVIRLTEQLRSHQQHFSSTHLTVLRRRRARLNHKLKDLKSQVARLNKVSPTLFLIIIALSFTAASPPDYRRIAKKAARETDSVLHKQIDSLKRRLYKVPPTLFPK